MFSIQGYKHLLDMLQLSEFKLHRGMQERERWKP